MVQPSVQLMPLGLQRTLNLQHVLENWIRLWLKTSAVCHLPLCCSFRSVVHFHLLEKVNLRAAAEMGGKGNPSQTLELALMACPLSIISERVSEFSSHHLLTICSKWEVLHSILHGTLQHLSGTKKFSSAQTCDRSCEVWRGLLSNSEAPRLVRETNVVADHFTTCVEMYVGTSHRILLFSVSDWIKYNGRILKKDLNVNLKI